MNVKDSSSDSPLSPAVCDAVVAVRGLVENDGRRDDARVFSDFFNSRNSHMNLKWYQHRATVCVPLGSSVRDAKHVPMHLCRGIKYKVLKMHESKSIGLVLTSAGTIILSVCWATGMHMCVFVCVRACFALILKKIRAYVKVSGCVLGPMSMSLQLNPPSLVLVTLTLTVCLLETQITHYKCDWTDRARDFLTSKLY